jgi:large subunit ribosomal protein L35
MPKMKTNRGAAKRFKLTGSGKVRFKRAGLRHCLSSKSTAAKKKLGKPGYLKDCDVKEAKELLRLI